MARTGKRTKEKRAEEIRREPLNSGGGGTGERRGARAKVLSAGERGIDSTEERGEKEKT